MEKAFIDGEGHQNNFNFDTHNIVVQHRTTIFFKGQLVILLKLPEWIQLLE